MILLKRNQYGEVIEPLERVTINKLFARSVIEKHVSGSVYADDRNRPGTIYIVHPYGMSLLFGNCDNEKFNADFRDYALNIHQTRNKHEWMQAFPDNWDNVLVDLFKGHLIKSSDNSGGIEKNVVELNTRVNFKFNLNKYLESKQDIASKNLSIVRTDKKIFDDMNGSVVPSEFWDSANDFCRMGVGFSLFYENKLATTAFSSYIHGNELELGMETIEEYRGKGFASLASSALIDYCLENNYEPVWSCRLENVGSYKLAVKLGFEPTLKLPYYRLSK